MSMTVAAAIAAALKLARRANKIAREAEELHQVLNALHQGDAAPALSSGHDLDVLERLGRIERKLDAISAER